MPKNSTTQWGEVLTNKLLNIMANLASNEENIDTCILAYVLKPSEENPDPHVEMMTMGSDLAQVLGMAELLKLEVYNNLNTEEGEEDA